MKSVESVHHSNYKKYRTKVLHNDNYGKYKTVGNTVCKLNLNIKVINDSKPTCSSNNYNEWNSKTVYTGQMYHALLNCGGYRGVWSGQNIIYFSSKEAAV